MRRIFLAAVIAASALIITQLALAADMPLKVRPLPEPAPAPTWTGFYGGVQIGGGWSNEAVNYSPNDPIGAQVINGTGGFPLEQPAANGYRIQQSGLVGGFEAGYNWQLSNWLLGLETDFSFSGVDGTASGTSNFQGNGGGIVQTQTTAAQQKLDWYGTVRGRAGWLATPNLLLFGTGGFAYGRVVDSANYTINGPPGAITFTAPFVGFAAVCVVNAACFSGSSSAIRTGWTAGGGIEWQFVQRWSAKIEYQFVDLGTETVRVTAFNGGGAIPASFNAAFHDRFNVVRVGLNYRFW
jgi:outer membrane immunogenic protein